MHTKEYFPFNASSVTSFPSKSLNTNGPPTFGRPTPLLISAMRFLANRSFSTWKYTIIPLPVITNSSAAFHENGPVELRARSWPIVLARACGAVVVNVRREGLRLGTCWAWAWACGWRVRGVGGRVREERTAALLAVVTGRVARGNIRGKCFRLDAMVAEEVFAFGPMAGVESGGSFAT